MEVLTEVPATGTKLRIDADRQFDGGPGDSTLRIQGQTQDGSPAIDATYVECSAEEAEMIGWFLRAIRQPQPELQEQIAKEVQSLFGSVLTGRDAHQVAELAWVALASYAREKFGMPPGQWGPIEHLAERFERAAARSQHSLPGTMTTGARS